MPPVNVPIANNANELLKMNEIIAFLEKSVQELLSASLVSMDKLRVKYPGLDISQSALILLALYLKAHNPNSPFHINEKYRLKLRKYLSMCQIIPELASAYEKSNVPTGNTVSKSDANAVNRARINASGKISAFLKADMEADPLPASNLVLDSDCNVVTAPNGTGAPVSIMDHLDDVPAILELCKDSKTQLLTFLTRLYDTTKDQIKPSDPLFHVSMLHFHLSKYLR
jgi:hypothetical protein